MLSAFINKAIERRYPWQAKPRIVICIPCGATSVEKRAVFEAAIQSGARQAYLIEEPMAAAMGADLPVTERWGGRVQVYPEWPSIVHLMRGEAYRLGDLRVFAMGGASSHDREWRVEGWSWFPEELPSLEELERAEKNLDAAGWDVDLVISHCCSSRMLPAALGAAGAGGGREGRDRLNEWFDTLEDRLDFQAWYFGHYHADAQLDERHRLIYRDIVRVA